MASGVVPLRGRGALMQAERPKRARIPSWDAGLMPRRPGNLRFARPGPVVRPLKKLQRLAERVRLRSCFASRNRFVRPRSTSGIPVSYSPTAVVHFCVRAAYIDQIAHSVFLTRRDAARQRGASERPKYDSAAVLDQRGAEIRAKTRWSRKSTTKSSKSPTTR